MELALKDRLSSLGERFRKKAIESSDSMANSVRTDIKYRKKDPYRTDLGAGAIVPLKTGDSEANILAKMLRFMTLDIKKQKDDLKSERSKDIKYQELQNKRTNELIWLFGSKNFVGKKQIGSSSKSTKFLATAGIGIFAAMYPEDILSKVDKIIKSIGDMSKTIDIKPDTTETFDMEKLISEPSKGIGPLKPTQFDELFKSMEEKYNLPKGLLKSVAKAESNFVPTLKSKKGAVGLMQVVPKEHGTTEKEMFVPEKNVEAGAKYLQLLLKMFKGDVKLAIAAYNAGQGNVMKAGNKIPNFPETQKYVKRVLENWEETPDSELPIQSKGLISPLLKPSKTTGEFEEERKNHPEGHRGIDLSAKEGDTIVASHSGVVELHPWDNNSAAGNYVVVKGDNYESKYMHMSQISPNLKSGQKVSKGEVIGAVGNTGHSSGPHLHFEIKKVGEMRTSNPENLIPQIHSGSSHQLQLSSNASVKQIPTQKLEVPKQFSNLSGKKQPIVAVNNVNNIYKHGDTITSVAQDSPDSNYHPFLNNQHG